MRICQDEVLHNVVTEEDIMGAMIGEEMVSQSC